LAVRRGVPIQSRPCYEIFSLGFSENISRTRSSFKKSKRVPRGGAAKLILRNGLAGLGGTAQLAQFQQHRKHTLELSVEMNLVAGEALKPVGIDGFAECLSA
jgi:hypothetical protein